MFLHSGASLHGHEYSNKRPSGQQIQTQLPLLRSTLRPLSEADAAPLVEQMQRQRLSYAAAPELARPALRQRPASDVTFKRQFSVRFQDSASDQSDDLPSLAVSEDESVAESELSDQTDVANPRRKRAKRIPRQSTRFALAHPAPHLRTKQRRLVQLRPRLLLQLQKVGDKRAVPAFDVIPSGLIAGSVIIPKLAERFPRMFGKKPQLGCDDVLIVQSEDYDSSSPDIQSRRRSMGGNDSLNHRNVLGVISAPHHNGDAGAEIDMEDGSSWFVKPTHNGSYEFSSVDVQGNVTTARWVRRRTQTQRRTLGSADDVTPPEDPKWTFSIIDPNTRRHPILGVMRPQSLEIFDHYSSMSSSSGLYPPTRPFGSAFPASPDVSPTSKSHMEERTIMEVPEEHKNLMLATGIFVSIRQEGWPASNNPKFARLAGHSRSTSSGASSPSRCGTNPSEAAPIVPYDMGVTARPPETRPAEQVLVKRRYTSASADSHSVTLPPRRSLSTGAAYMKKRLDDAELARDDRGPIYPESTSWPVRQSLAVDEKPSTCRSKLRNLTNRIFRRRHTQSSHDEALLAKS